MKLMEKENGSLYATLKREPIWLIAGMAIILSALYWGVMASDRYVSESSIVLESPEISVPTLSVQSLLSGGASASRGDMLLLRDHLMSVDMLKKLDQALSIREHYSQSSIDWFSRLTDTSNTIEELHSYYLRRVEIVFDDYAQVLRIKVQAYDADTAHQIGQFLLREGEAHMNLMGQRLAQEQVRFLERQVSELRQRFDADLQKLIAFQNQSGLVSAQGELESLSSVIASMQSQLAMLTAQRKALLTYQSQNSAEVLRVNAEIKALNEQIAQERSRLAQASGGALNVLSSEYQLLEMNMQFARESYSSALAALQSTRIEAARQLKQVSVLQSPSMPEYAIEPRRLYNITVFSILTLLLALIAQMMAMIIRDHRD